MPKSFKLTSEARENLLKEAQKWREEFALIAKSKDPTAMVAKPLVAMVDGVCSSVNHTMEKVEEIQKTQGRMALGMERTTGMATTALADLGEQQKKVEAIDGDHEATKKLAHSTDRRCNRALNYVQKLQLENSAKVIVVRGIHQQAKKEGYIELQQLIQQVFASINVVGIRPTYVRRMPQAGKDRKDPPAVKIALQTVGDKITIYNAFDTALQAHKTLPFGISNEIPQYALGSYKHQQRIAAELRSKYPGTKTRVGIARNATWPTITVREKGTKHFVKIDEKIFEEAREVVMQKQKALNESKKERKREAAFMNKGIDDDDDEDMNVDQSTSGAAKRPDRMAKHTEKTYK